MRIIITLSLLAILLLSCNIKDPIPKYQTGTFPETPVNLENFNSGYDDYNSTAPTLGGIYALCFSSNRNTQGKTYDIIRELLSIEFSKISGVLTVDNTPQSWWEVSQNFNPLNLALNLVNTPSNEYGPYIKNYWNIYNVNASDGGSRFLFLYATDQSGNLDIKFVENFNAPDYENLDFAGPYPVSVVNTSYNEAYPTFNKDISELYFTSDRDQSYDIYKVKINLTDDIVNTLYDTIATDTCKKVTELSSVSDDKCPYIMDDVMVFTSDRAGGFGGFDLWYSTFDGTKWSTPVNFGEKINTPYDEYRPILISMPEFTNDFLIFSSNRPGGKGGFDLYYVGVPRIQPVLARSRSTSD